MTVIRMSNKIHIHHAEVSPRKRTRHRSCVMNRNVKLILDENDTGRVRFKQNCHANMFVDE